jgi:hypothetical protein
MHCLETGKQVSYIRHGKPRVHAVILRVQEVPSEAKL